LHLIIYVTPPFLPQITAEELPGGYSDTKGVVSALLFALKNSAKYDVEENILHVEIQQLGLPKVLF
jgi:hypothetical protein